MSIKNGGGAQSVTDGAVASLADEVLFEFLVECPDHAAELGVQEVNGRALPVDRMPDFSRDAALRWGRRAEHWVQILDRIPLSGQGREQEITRGVLRYWLTDGFQGGFVGVNGLRHAEHIEPLTHLNGVHVAAEQLLVSESLDESPEGNVAWHTRLGQLPRAVRQTTELLRDRRQRGFIAPKMVLLRAISDIRRSLSDSVGADIYTKSLERRLRSIPAEEKDRYSAAARKLISLDVRPSYEELLEELFRHANSAGDNFSAARRPGGDAFYAWLLRAYTTSNYSPEQAHALGLEELTRLDDQVRSELSALGLPSDRAKGFGAWAAQTAYPPSAKGRFEAERDVREWTEIARQATRPLFNLWPKAEARIEPIAFEQETSVHSHYLPPRSRTGGAGVFRVNLAHITEVGRAEAPIHCFHEVWPGHHLQLALAAEADLCAFRRAVLFRAFLEGWAKYAESLPEKAGLTTPFTRLARLRMELYSTATLVMDTGIHSRGWTLEQARSFFVSATSAPPLLADMVVLRSAAKPAELTAYKIGLLKLRALCSKLTGDPGRSLTIPQFHDAVLRHGAVPLGMLDDLVSGESVTLSPQQTGGRS